MADIPASAIVMIGGIGTPTGSDTELSGRKVTCEIAGDLHVFELLLCHVNLCDQPSSVSTAADK